MHAQISAGDSHSAALDSTGRVWLWGTFRGANGAIGLTKDGEISRAPVLLSSFTDRVVMKIASGQDHLVCLTDEGLLFTMGCGEQGQLGRIAERFAKDGGRNGIGMSFFFPIIVSLFIELIIIKIHSKAINFTIFKVC